MSVFHSDDRILLEEIVETTEEQEDLCSNGETVDESSVTTDVAVAEVIKVQEQQQLQQQQKNQVVPAGAATICRSIGQNVVLNGNSASNLGRVTSRSHMEQEKRIRREIANSNERRRMQSINAGFQSLRTLLPHHEGEKLSKAAILQQTAEYIYQLEQEKTQLLSQNCQLKRLVNQHEGGDVPIKKRKAESQGVVLSLPVHVNESGDEGLGSMSPEPLSVITVSADGHSVLSSEVIELRRQLERERQTRNHLEKQMRAIQNQLYPERFRDSQLIAYQPHEVIEHTDNVLAQETEESVAALQVVSVVSLPPVGSTQTVETTTPDSSSPPLSPEPVELVAEEIKEEENSQPSSPKIVTFASQIFPSIEEQTSSGSFSPTRVTYTTESGNSSSQYITSSPSRTFSPEEEVEEEEEEDEEEEQVVEGEVEEEEEETQRLPSVLEAAMKAEPKVEVERSAQLLSFLTVKGQSLNDLRMTSLHGAMLPSPSNSLDDGTPQARLYLANTSRQNLETIVEAIRHLEGDHLFSDEPAQDVPLALTNKPTSTASSSNKQRLLHAEVNNFLQFHSQPQTQQRPGVIVVKHS